MNIAYFDCLSGISGNMTLGALLANGLKEETLLQGLQQLPLEEWRLNVNRVLRNGIAAIHVEVDDHVHRHHHQASGGGHTHAHRGLRDILQLIETSALPPPVQQCASAIFTRLGQAEAEVHGTTVDEVHFHEVGAIDAIVDIVGTAIGMHALGITRVFASPLPLGQGWVQCAHGEFPVPAPATALLVRGAQIAETDIVAELVTPTGAAIITSLAEQYGPLPAMRIRSVGYGAGTRVLPRPNVLRLYLGEMAESGSPTEEIITLQTTMDDMPGEVLGYLMERLLAAGARDVYYSPVQMKKNRPGIEVTILCDAEIETDCLHLLFSETSTLGVRRVPVQRTCLPRDEQMTETPYGPVRVKISEWAGQQRIEPEYEDCRRCALSAQVPLRDVYRAAYAAYTTLIE